MSTLSSSSISSSYPTPPPRPRRPNPLSSNQEYRNSVVLIDDDTGDVIKVLKNGVEITSSDEDESESDLDDDGDGEGENAGGGDEDEDEEEKRRKTIYDLDNINYLNDNDQTIQQQQQHLHSTNNDHHHHHHSLQGISSIWAQQISSPHHSKDSKSKTQSKLNDNDNLNNETSTDPGPEISNPLQKAVDSLHFLDPYSTGIPPSKEDSWHIPTSADSPLIRPNNNNLNHNGLVDHHHSSNNNNQNGEDSQQNTNNSSSSTSDSLKSFIKLASKTGINLHPSSSDLDNLLSPAPGLGNPGPGETEKPNPNDKDGDGGNGGDGQKEDGTIPSPPELISPPNNHHHHHHHHHHPSTSIGRGGNHFWGGSGSEGLEGGGGGGDGLDRRLSGGGHNEAEIVDIVKGLEELDWEMGIGSGGFGEREGSLERIGREFREGERGDGDGDGDGGEERDEKVGKATGHHKYPSDTPSSFATISSSSILHHSHSVASVSAGRPKSWASSGEESIKTVTNPNENLITNGDPRRIKDAKTSPSLANITLPIIPSPSPAQSPISEGNPSGSGATSEDEFVSVDGGQSRPASRARTPLPHRLLPRKKGFSRPESPIVFNNNGIGAHSSYPSQVESNADIDDSASTVWMTADGSERGSRRGSVMTFTNGGDEEHSSPGIGRTPYHYDADEDDRVTVTSSILTRPSTVLIEPSSSMEMLKESQRTSRQGSNSSEHSINPGLTTEPNIVKPSGVLLDFLAGGDIRASRLSTISEEKFLTTPGRALKESIVPMGWVLWEGVGGSAVTWVGKKIWDWMATGATAATAAGAKTIGLETDGAEGQNEERAEGNKNISLPKSWPWWLGGSEGDKDQNSAFSKSKGDSNDTTIPRNNKDPRRISVIYYDNDGIGRNTYIRRGTGSPFGPDSGMGWEWGWGKNGYGRGLL